MFNIKINERLGVIEKRLNDIVKYLQASSRMQNGLLPVDLNNIQAELDDCKHKKKELEISKKAITSSSS